MKTVANSRFAIKSWRVVGQVAGKAGSFVLQRTGTFENGGR